MKASRKQLTQRRHYRIRRRVEGSGDRPRLAVFRVRGRRGYWKSHPRVICLLQQDRICHEAC